MKLMRLAMCVAVFALIGGIAFSEDMDIRSLQAKLAAQEARLNDMQAKMNSSKSSGSEAEGVVSLRKNAVVTIGGTVNTRYFYRDGDVTSAIARPASAHQANGETWVSTPATYGNYTKREDFRYGDMRISDAKVELKIDVNEYFDAYLKMDLQDGAGRADVSGVAQNYWVRWKNVCNSGFGLLVGRDALKFGDSQPIGILDSWNKDSGGSVGDMTGSSAYVNAGALGYNGQSTYGEGMFAYGNLLPSHTTWNWTRTTQINPYWESQDKKLKIELSLIQDIDRINGHVGNYNWNDNGVREFRSINYGVGSGTARITWKPIEGLKLVASALNYYTNTDRWQSVAGPAGNKHPGLTNYGVETSSSNSAVNLAFQYRPCFFNRLNVWSQWTHGWNEAWVKNQDSDSINAGFSFDITEQLTFFAMGDYLRVKNKQATTWYSAKGWAFYTGMKYVLPYGVNLEAGWRHDKINYKDNAGYKHTRFSGDTIYGHLGFDF